MSKRLQVVMDDDELVEIQEIAQRRRMTVAEWVRQALREARREEPRKAVQAKLDAVAAAARNEFPAGDIESMLADIERGRHAAGV